MTDVLTRIRERASGMGKAMADLHPEFQERQLIASLRSDEVSTWAPYSYLSALGHYESHVWVRKAIKVIADNFSPLPLQVMRGKEIAQNHDLLGLFTAVNNTMSSPDLWQQWVVDMLLGGEEGWELVRSATNHYAEIWPRQPHTIGVIPDPERRRYFQVAKYRIDDGQGEPYELPPDEFVHFKFFNPRNPWRGIAPITAVRTSIVIDVLAQAWSKLFYQKSARPDYALIAPQGLGKSEREDLERMLVTKFGGIENAHKPVVLEEGITDIKLLSFPPKDLEWVELRGMSREEIGAIFGVPDEIMGWGRDTYENFDTAHWVLWVLTLLPLCGFRDMHLTEYFRRVKMLRPDETIVTDTSQVAALKKDLKTKLEMLDLLCERGVPVNVASAYLALGLPAIDGGDVGYLPISMVPVGDLGLTSPVGDGGPAKGVSTVRQKALAYDSVEHRQLWDVFVKRTGPWEKKLGQTVAQILREQEQDVLQRLRGGKTARPVAGAVKSPADAAENPFDREKWDVEFRKRVKPILRKIVASAGADALTDLALDLAFDVDEPRVVEFLKQREQRFAEHVDETTWTRLQESLSEGIDAGETMPELEARVGTEMGDRIRSSEEVIARTECLPAETLVDTAVVRAAYRRWYEGPMVTLVSESGREFTATPNHPVLTRRGWLAAGKVNEGDDLICNGGQQDAGSPGNEHVADPPTAIGKIFEAASAIGVTERRGGRKPDFHGDGSESEVEVAHPNRELRIGHFAPLYKPLLDNILAPSDWTRAPVCERCGRLLSIDKQPCLCIGSGLDALLGENPRDDIPIKSEGARNCMETFARSISRDNTVCVDVGPIARRMSAVTEKLPASLAKGSGDASLSSSGLDSVATNAQLLSDSSLAQSGTIEFDRVVSKRVWGFGGHVFNLSTPYGYFTSSGVYTGNTIGCSNGGTLQAWKQTDGIVEGKTWLAALDDRVRDTHRDAHERYQKDPIGIDEDFEVGEGNGPAPGQIGLPEEDIQCRCSMTAVLRSRALGFWRGETRGVAQSKSPDQVDRRPLLPEIHVAIAPPQVTVNLPPSQVTVENQITTPVPQVDVHVPAPVVTVQNQIETPSPEIAVHVPAPVVNVANHVETPAPEVHVEAPQVTVENRVETPSVAVDVAAPQVKVENKTPKRERLRVVRDSGGRITEVVNEGE